jgi:hypothetical protein
MAVKRLASMPLSIRYCRTASARCWESVRLNSAAPMLSVWPWISSDTSGQSCSDTATSSRAWLDSGFNIALPLSKVTPLSISASRVISFDCGQPPVSAGPGLLGHLSSRSTMPSLSLSTSGQPLFSAIPGTLGQLSSLSIIPSLSLSN